MAIYVKKEPNIISKQHIVTVSYNTPKTVLQQHAEQLVVSPDTRTIWYAGVPYGTSYQFAPQNNTNVSGDVFGDVTSHSLNGKNELAVGTGIVTYNNNTVGIGIYNKYNNTTTDSNAYAFTIGNGTSNTTRSNALTVTRAGDVTAYQIANTKLDTSYVSSLGSNASVNIILKALLTPSNYYEPILTLYQSVAASGQNRNVLVSKSFTSFNFGVYWESNKPKYDTTFIYKYVEQNTKLPSGVTLDMLGYTKCIVASDGSTTNYKTGSLNYKINVNTNTSGTVKQYTMTYDKIQPSQTNLSEIYNGKNSAYFTINNGSVNYTWAPVVTFAASTPGINYAVNQTLTFYYETPQLNYFKQLVDNGVFVFSDGKAWTSIKSKTLSIRLPIYWGFYLVYGFFGTNTVWEKTIPTNVIEDALNNTSSSGQITHRYKKYALITNNYNTVYLPTSLKENASVYFGKTKMDIDSYSDGKVKYFFVAFRTGYIKLADSTDTAPLKAKTGAGSDVVALAAQTNVTINYKDATYTNNNTWQYTVYAGKLDAQTVYFDEESASGVNIRIRMLQTGLNGTAK